MSSKKPLHLREKELQSLMATEAGREELLALAARYGEEDGCFRPERSSVITYILVHERQRGLIEV
jgi:hypothetical protein